MAEIPYDYHQDADNVAKYSMRLEDEGAELEYAEKVEMTPRQRKLEELRRRMRVERNKNRKEVVEEDKAKKNPEKASIAAKREYEEKREKEREEAEKLGISDTQMKFLSTTVDKSHHDAKKKRKAEKRLETFGWAKYNTKGVYKAYQKRQRDNDFSIEKYKEKKASVPITSVDDVDALAYGEDDAVPPAALEKMTKELAKLEQRRKNFSRRRAFNDEEDVTYINQGNMQFNKKIGRAYDKFTVEIRQNLERGTAI